MALRFVDSFDHYATADFLKKWTSYDVPYAPAIASGGRTGNCLQITGRYCEVSMAFDAQSTWILGAAFKFVSTAGDTSMLVFRDGANIQCGLYLNADGTLTFKRGYPTVDLGTSTGHLVANAWYYIECKVTIGNAGSFSVRVNSTEWIGNASCDTQHTANATANTVALDHAGGNNYYVDDLYICDGTGATNNDFLGDVTVQCVFPAADGATTDFTPSTGTDNYATVDDASLSETDYNGSGTLNHVDTLAFGNVTAGATVLGVQAWADAWKSAEEARSIALIARPGTTDHAGSDHVLGTSGLGCTEVWETNPDTSQAWNPVSLNASEFGYKVTA